MTDDGLEAMRVEAERKLLPPRPAAPEPLAAQPTVDENQFISFAYLQTEAVIFHLRWHSLTHVGSRFIDFDETGNIVNSGTWTGRSSYIQSGGAADAAGVKVHMVVRNGDGPDANPFGFDLDVLEDVMNDSGRRSTLISDITSLVSADSYVHGVSFDFEPFAWSATTRGNMATFFSDLRTALDGIDPSLEISWYVDPTPNATQFDIPSMEPNIDFFLYSAYDWATGNTAHAISDFNNYVPWINNFYLTNGVPQEKLVKTISVYSRRWNFITSYNATGASPESQGWTDGRYDTTLNTLNGGPQSDNYVTGDEVGWHTWNETSIDRVRTWEAREGAEYKIRHVLSNQDGGGTFNGQRLGGVGFWSTNWLAEQLSHDMNTSTDVGRTRTYPHVYQMLQEILSPPGTRRFLIDGFEGYDFRWRDPNESPDTAGDTDNDSMVSNPTVTSPGGAGQPLSTTNAMQVTFDFESGSGNQLFFRHEILATRFLTSVPDLNAPAAVFDQNTAVFVHLHTPTSYLGRQVRMLVVDADGELEMSNPYTLNASGWRELEWDLTDATEINAYTTSEAPFNSGDGVLDSAGGGEEDIGFIGFLIEGGGAGSGTVTFDELAYEHRNPGGLEYVINEFRYDDAGADDEEFIEIHGPAGSFPAGTQVRLHDPTDGSVLGTFALSGSIVDAGGGFGFWVIGDTGVPGVNSTTGFGGDDIPNTDPSSIQIYNTNTGNVYDSVVYEAWGGLDDLIRRETLGVVDEGWPWLGEIASGTDSSSVPYTLGRLPDGSDTDVNSADFGAMVATPGAANGSGLTLPVTFDFATAPTSAVQTFQNFAVGASGVGPSSDGGNVYRCVDTTGGGVMAFFGDASLGSGGAGCNVEGEIYIPSSGEPLQAVAVGFCGSQGTRFFSTSAADVDRGAYEDGYWLIYENASGVALNDGQPDHAGVFEFVHATHDNMDGNPVDLLGSASDAAVGITPGGWTTFRLTIDPAGPPVQQLLAKINGVDVFRGDIPTDGPSAGAFLVGFRENHGGAPAGNEGTWIDGVTINSDNNIPGIPIPVELSVLAAD
jgi:hypothetical protein